MLAVLDLPMVLAMPRKVVEQASMPKVAWEENFQNLGFWEGMAAAALAAAVAEI